MLSDKITNCPIFNGVDSTYIKSILKENKLQKIRENEYVFHQGDQGDGMYVVLNGKLDVISEGDENNVIATIESGSFFGEICLLTEQKRTAGIKATQDSQLLYISLHDFKERINKQEIGALRISHNISVALAERLEKASELIHSFYQEGQHKKSESEIANYKKRLLSEVLL